MEKSDKKIYEELSYNEKTIYENENTPVSNKKQKIESVDKNSLSNYMKKKLLPKPPSKAYMF